MNRRIETNFPLNKRWLLIAVLMLLMAVKPDVHASDRIESAGDALRYVLPVTATGLTLLHWDAPGLLQFLESALLTKGTTSALKVIVNEKRPNGEKYSFPSGHTSITFCSAEFIRRRYGWTFGVPAYAAAAFVGYSRVEAKKHWVHDVVAGAALGFTFSAIFTHPYKEWSIRVCSDGESYSVRLYRIL